MFSESKDGWPAFSRITPNAFKDTGTIMKDMGHNVNSRIFPTDKLAVVPYNIANARSSYVFRLAAFWEHIHSLLQLIRLRNWTVGRFPESKNFSTYRKLRFGALILPNYSRVSGHGTIQ